MDGSNGELIRTVAIRIMYTWMYEKPEKLKLIIHAM